MTVNKGSAGSQILQRLQDEKRIPDDLQRNADVIEEVTGSVDMQITDVLTYRKQIRKTTIAKSTYKRRQGEGISYESLDIIEAAPSGYRPTEIPVVEDVPVEECEECRGRGDSTCPDCRGSGDQDCSTCDGTGAVDCTLCGGDGTDTCRNCRGQGTVQVEYDTTCPNCGGSSQVQCPNCGGSSQIRCPECAGEDADCRECNGDFTVICPECTGEGVQGCPECDGTGTAVETRSEQCPECSGVGTQNCRSCNGSGDTRCSACDGSGTEDCHQCSGSGRTECRFCSGEGKAAVGNMGHVEFNIEQTTDLDKSEHPSFIVEEVNSGHGTVVSENQTPPGQFEQSGSRGTIRKKVTQREIPYNYLRYSYDGKEYEAATIHNGEGYQLYYDEFPVSRSSVREQINDAQNNGTFDFPTVSAIANHTDRLEKQSHTRKIDPNASDSIKDRLLREPVRLMTDSLFIAGGSIVAIVGLFVVGLVIDILLLLVGLVIPTPDWLSNLLIYGVVLFIMLAVAFFIGIFGEEDNFLGYELVPTALIVGAVLYMVMFGQLGSTLRDLALSTVACFASLRVGRRLQIESNRLTYHKLVWERFLEQLDGDIDRLRQSDMESELAGPNPTPSILTFKTITYIVSVLGVALSLESLGLGVLSTLLNQSISVWWTTYIPSGVLVVATVAAGLLAVNRKQ